MHPPVHRPLTRPASTLVRHERLRRPRQGRRLPPPPSAPCTRQTRRSTHVARPHECRPHRPGHTAVSHLADRPHLMLIHDSRDAGVRSRTTCLPICLPIGSVWTSHAGTRGDAGHAWRKVFQAGEAWLTRKRSPAQARPVKAKTPCGQDRRCSRSGSLQPLSVRYRCRFAQRLGRTNQQVGGFAFPSGVPTLLAQRNVSAESPRPRFWLRVFGRV